MTNRHDLILQLSKLNPTKRQWVYDGIRLIRCFRKNLFITHDAKKDDIHLTLLAPTMRIEILAMAKEIEELEYEVKHLADPLMYPKNKFTKCEDCIHIACENHGKCIKPLII